MSTINSITNSTYIPKQNSQTEISTLIKERESLQKELETLQEEVSTSSGEESQNFQVQIESLESQITSIDAQIARLQGEEKSTGVKEVPSIKLNNEEVLSSTLNKLDESSKLLENEIVLDKGRGFDSEIKDKTLSNMKNNMEEINSRLKEKNIEKSKNLNIEKELVGNFIDSEA